MLAMPAWFDVAACRGAGPSRFFVESGLGVDSTGSEAKAVCAGCPAVARCLDRALTNHEQSGIWGGTGEAERRSLYAPQRSRPHQDPEVQPGCSCGWCVAVRDVLDALDGVRAVAPNHNRHGATHGLRSTQAKGCRCPPCVASASSLGQALTRSGVNTATFWTENVDPWLLDDEQAHQFAVAGGEVLVGAAAGLLALAGVPSDVAIEAFLGTWYVTRDSGSLRPWAESLTVDGAPEMLAA